jgi:uncharacterized protein YdcH (DUF465 family)
MKKIRLTVKDTTPSALDEIIERFEKVMVELDPTDVNYQKMLDQLNQLYKIRETEKSPRRVDANTLAIILGNLAGIVLVINAERLHVLTSKAASMAFRSVR